MRQLAQDYWMFLEGSRLRFLFFMLVRFSSQACAYGVVWSTGILIDWLSTSGIRALSQLYLYAGMIALFSLGQVFFRFWSKMELYEIGAQIRLRARSTATERLISTDLRWHEEQDAGSKMQRVSQGGEQLYALMNYFANDGMSTFADLTVSLFLLFVAGPAYGIYALCYAFLFLTCERYFSHQATLLQEELSAFREKMSGKLNESLSNLLTVQSLGLQTTMSSKTKSLEEQYYEIWRRSTRYNKFKQQFIKSFSAFGHAAFFVLAGSDVIAGSITVGALVAYVGYIGRLRSVLDNLSDTIGDLISIKVAVGRFMEFFGISRAKRGTAQVGQWKEIVFDQVRFSYKKRKIIEGFNLRIHRGERIGIVGTSGCGKSTIVKLLLGLYKPHAGDITIDGISLQRLDPLSVSQMMSVVLQESEMFNATVLENITLQTERIDRQRLFAALRIAQVESLVKKLPKGLQTILGEKGYKVSGGERQRIALARAIYRQPSLLVLDEATSHLDSGTEKVVQEHLDHELQGTTMLIVAHRLSTLRNVTRILVMEKGRVLEQGTFEELVKLRGKFAELYWMQRNR